MKDIFEGTGDPVSEDGFNEAASSLNATTDPAKLWAILAVETRGFGYLPDRRPKILFERHVFHKRTGGRFSAGNPDISNANTGGYVGGAAEYQRLKRAMLLDRRAALESASWGLGQVMGFNATAIGYATVEAMVEEFKASEDKQLDGCAKFITSKPALKRALDRQDWATVAFFYNGSGFRKNHYDEKLRSSHAQFVRSPPAVRIRAAQARLTYLGINPKGIDGVIGGGTTAAIKAFQGANALKVSGILDDATATALEKAAGV